MNKQREKITKDICREYHISGENKAFMDWLYSNGYGIVNVSGIPTSIYERSEFMEEWEKHYKETGFKSIAERVEYLISILPVLIDRYKADKFLPTPKPMTREEEIEETKRRG